MDRSNRSAPEASQTIDEVLRRWPGAAAALRCCGLGACVGCALATFETVGDAARAYGLDPRRVLHALRTAAERGSR